MDLSLKEKIDVHGKTYDMCSFVLRLKKWGKICKHEQCRLCISSKEVLKYSNFEVFQFYTSLDFELLPRMFYVRLHMSLRWYMLVYICKHILSFSKGCA